MEVRRSDDAAAWLDAAGRLLLADEARHDLILGLAGTLISHPSVYEDQRLWTVEQRGTVVGAALQTPPHNLVLSRPTDEDATPALASSIHEDGVRLPGVTGAAPECETFADVWSGLTGDRVRPVMGQGIYRLREVRDVPVAAGGPRKAHAPEDLELVLAWLDEFIDEVVPPEIRGSTGERRRNATATLSSDEGGYWLWEDAGRIVSMTGSGGPTPNGIRIGPVYTPPADRGHGYATSLVAAVSREQLSSGRTFCFLHTDLANPTSNAIYRRIGYERVCDSTVVAFDPG
jgi:predicted GNAT family acetyltransferase